MMASSKSSDHVQKVEPLFAAKNANYDVLNSKVKEREVIKDAKIEFVQQIRMILCELKELRE